MQIREVVLYGYNGKVRKIKFILGRVNIITGTSKTGKSVIGDIIDYCLGSSSCNIADGIVRNNVDWYGVLIQFEHERVFIARKNPDKGQNSKKCYIDIGEKIEAPQNCEFFSNINIDGIKEELNMKVGITGKIDMLFNEEQSVLIKPNIRHALYYCFQNQDEIAAKNFLFHKQASDFTTKDIKDTILYFLGVVNKEVLISINKITKLKKDLKVKTRQYHENTYLKEVCFKRTAELIGEARRVGLIHPLIEIDYKNYKNVYSILKNVVNWSPDQFKTGTEVESLLFLQKKLRENRNEFNEINIKIDNIKNFIKDITGYSNESEYQKKRLESIGLFEELDFNPEKCPICSGKLEHPMPSVDMMKTSIVNLNKSISNVTIRIPELEASILDLEQKREKKREEMRLIEAEIDGLYYSKEKQYNLQDISIEIGKVIGKISLWIESVENNKKLEEQMEDIKRIEEQIEKTYTSISLDYIEEYKQHALSRIQEDMTKWAKDLKLENFDNPYRLDLNKMTVVVDKQERSVPLKQLGSGSNWVGVHLISYFALQYFFIKSNRPVPRFLFLDQPSQVYFPSGIDNKQVDWDEVKKIYKFIIERTEELKGKLQVIIVDHANLKEDFFKNSVCENWWIDDGSLIPKDWYEN